VVKFRTTKLNYTNVCVLRSIFLHYLTDFRVTLGHNEAASSIPREHAWKATVYKVCAVEAGTITTHLLNCKNTEKL